MSSAVRSLDGADISSLRGGEGETDKPREREKERESERERQKEKKGGMERGRARENTGLGDRMRGKKCRVVEACGNWDDRDAQRRNENTQCAQTARERWDGRR